MDLEILRKVGLSEGEIKIYSALLDLGPTSLNGIHERIGIDRRNIYDILNKLIERGLVSYIKTNDKRVFRASNPDRLLSYVEEKKSNLNEIKAEIEKVIPSMQALFKEQKQSVFAEIFKGPEGMKTVWDDMLNYDAVYWIGSGMYVPNRFPAYFKAWDKRRATKNVLSKHLFRYEKRSEWNKKTEPNGRFLPPEFSGNPTVTAVYGNKVAQMLFGDEIYMFVIESEELAENYKKYHKFLWEKVAKA